MSEYIEIETEEGDDPDTLYLFTNLQLAEGEERYAGAEALEEGSALAQALAFVPGIRRLEIAGSQMVVERDPDTPWHIIVADISAAIRDFFL